MTEKRKGRGCAFCAACLSLLLMFSVLTGCTSGSAAEQKAETDTRLNVVTTLFPYYDFLRQIAGDQIQLTLVVPAGMNSHSFEPTPADMITIQNADLIVCNGGAMEQWVLQVVDSFGEDGFPGRLITMMDYVDTVQEETVEGMEHSHHHHHHHTEGPAVHHPDHHHEEHAEEPEHHHEEDSHWEIEYDEHIWTSPVNAMKLSRVLADTLEEMDPDHAADYEASAEQYISRLAELDEEIRGIVKNGKRHILLFGDKFPLRYFCDEYGLEYRAAFSGCSSDTEPSAKTIAYLIEKVKENQVPAIYYLELSSPRVAEIISEETGAEPLLFHSCHNVTRREFDTGVTYLELMKQNVINLKKGLE